MWALQVSPAWERSGCSAAWGRESSRCLPVNSYCRSRAAPLGETGVRIDHSGMVIASTGTDLVLWNESASVSPDRVTVTAGASRARAVVEVRAVTADVPATLVVRSGADGGRTQAAIRLYTWIFNYRGPPAVELSLRV